MMPRRDELKDVVARVWPMVVCAVVLAVSIFLHPQPPRWLVFIVGAVVGGSVWQIFIGTQHAILLGRAEAMLANLKAATDELEGHAEFVREGGELVLRRKIDPKTGGPVLERKPLH